MSNRRSIRWVFDCSKWYPTRQEWMTASASVQPDEKERIGKFFFKRDAKNSMAGRLLIRKFLAMYSGRRWKDVNILKGEHGKPYVEKSNGTAVDFNISHQGNYALLAGEVGDVTVGVDVMAVEYKSGEKLADFLKLMSKQFSKQEMRTIRSPQSERDVCRRFYRFWCLKESYIKATGTGLTESLQDISFDIKEEVVSDTFITSTEVIVSGERLADWSFQEILIDDDTFAAVALSPKLQPVTHQFQRLSFEELVKEAEEVTPYDEEYCDNFFKKLNFP